MSDPMDRLAAQIGARQELPRPQHANPRPADVIRPGSGTDVLLRFLRLHPLRWFFHVELVVALGRSKGEVDWALQYLTGRASSWPRRPNCPGASPWRYKLKRN